MRKIYFYVVIVCVMFFGFTTDKRMEWTEWVEWSEYLDCNYYLHIDSEPQEAEVYVAGEYYDITPCTIMIDFKVAFIWESRELFKYYSDNGQEKKERINIEARNFRVEVQEGVTDKMIVEVYKDGYKPAEKIFDILPDREKPRIEDAFINYKPFTKWPEPVIEEYWSVYLEKK